MYSGLSSLSSFFGETVPDALAQPVAFPYGVPGFLAGVGMAIIYRRFISHAIVSNRGLGRVVPLAVTPQTPAIFGVVVSFVLIGEGLHRAGETSLGTETVWTASVLAVVGGIIGGPVGAWLGSSSWDLETTKRWPEALAKSGWSGYVTLGCFALAMEVLGEWLIALPLALWSGAVLGFGLVLFVRARRKRQEGMKNR